MPRDPRLEDGVNQAPEADDQSVQDFLDGLAAALTQGDGRAVAEMWETPAFVLGDDMAKVVSDPDEIAAFFGGARQQYQQIGIINTRAEIVRLDEITDRMVMVRVRWPYLDAYGREMGAETSTYTLVRGKDEWRLRIAVMHGKEAMN